MAELNKRIITSFSLLVALYLSIINIYILTIISLLVYFETFYEIFNILKNIYKKKIKLDHTSFKFRRRKTIFIYLYNYFYFF